MKAQASGVWSAPDPATGKRSFVRGAVALSIGQRVRVMALGYGSTYETVGREGTVVSVGTTRVGIDFGPHVKGGTIVRINGICLGILQEGS